MNGSHPKYLTLTIRKLLGAAVCVAALGGTCLGQEAQLSAEEVVKNALQVLNKVHDVRGSATCQYWWRDRSSRDSSGNPRVSLAKGVYECYNMAFIGPPGGPMRVDFKERQAKDGRAVSLDEWGLGHMRLFFNGKHLLEFAVDDGHAHVQEKNFRGGLKKYYEFFHPLSAVAHLADLTKQTIDSAGHLKLVSVEGSLYTIKETTGGTVATYRIDQGQAFSVKELIVKGGEEIAYMGYSWEVESVRLKEDIWLPRTIKRIDYAPGGKHFYRKIETTFDKLEANSGLRIADLKMPLPPGTLFTDPRRGIKKIIGGDVDGPREK